MKSLFGGLAEKVKSAGKNLTEMAYEPSEDQKFEKEIHDLKEEIQNLKKILVEKTQTIEKINQELKSRPNRELSNKSERLIDFRIIIGMEDSGKAIEMLESVESQSKILQSKYENLLNDYIKIKEEKNIIQDSLKFERASTESLTKKLEISQKTLKDKESNLNSLQESFLQLKRSQKADIKRFYIFLKKSFPALGIPISQNLHIDTLGAEDLEEFFQIQTNQILDIANKVNQELKGKFGIQEIRSLDEVKAAVTIVTEESTRKVLEYKEIAFASEKLLQNAQKENNDLMKKFSEQLRSAEILQKNLAKIESENKNMKETLAELERIKSESEQIKGICKKITEESIEKQKKYEEEMIKFEKTYTYVSSIEEELSEFKVKVRQSTSSMEEKDHQINELKKVKETLLVQLQEVKNFSSSEVLSTKLYHENIIKRITDEFHLEKKNLNEKFSTQIKILEDKLRSAQKNSDELQFARSKISEHDKGIQEFHKVLNEMQARLSTLTKINENLVEEKEKMLSEFGEKEKKLMDLSEKYKEERTTLIEKVKEFEEKYKGIDEQVKDAEKMRAEASELMEKVQTKIENEENWIDRRMVITFLVNFLNENNTEKMKVQMLKPFVEMLGLSHEQRVKIGLEQEPGLLAQFTNFLTRG